MFGRKKRKGKEEQEEQREAGTSGQKGSQDIAPTRTLPPDPQELGRPMTPDEKVDEASLQSMDGSDPPSYMPTSTGAPNSKTSTSKIPTSKTSAPPEAESDSGVDSAGAGGEGRPDEAAIRRRAHELWEADGAPAGRDQEYWYRAEQELRRK